MEKVYKCVIAYIARQSEDLGSQSEEKVRDIVTKDKITGHAETSRKWL